MLGLALLLTGCTATGAHQPGSVYRLQPAPTDIPDVQFSFPHLWDSIDQVAEQTTGVVLATPVIKREVMLDEHSPRTLVTFRLEQVIEGEFETGQEIDVRYLGAMDSPSDGPLYSALPSHPVEGLQYLLMLRTAPKETAYGVTGPGQWVREFDDQRFALDLRNRDMLSSRSTIPLDITVEEMVKEMERIRG